MCFPGRNFRPHRVWAIVSPGTIVNLSKKTCLRLPKVRKVSRFLTEVGGSQFQLDTSRYVQQVLRELQVPNHQITMLAPDVLWQDWQGNDIANRQSDSATHLLAGVVCRT